MDKRKLEDILDELKIKVNTKGYKYWIAAVQKKLEKEDMPIGNIYIEIAKKYNSNYSRVERALRSAYTHNIVMIQEYFSIDYEICNTIFLALLIRELERRQQ